MVSIFRTLRDDEIDIVFNAPAMVAVLLAGADDKIDKYEINEAINFVRNAADKYPVLKEYLDELSVVFDDVFAGYRSDLPKGLQVRQHTINSYLRQLNGILPKLDVQCAREIRLFLTDLAKAVAEASGGIMGMRKISSAESKYLDLDMIHLLQEVD
jgi:hypothetical protein